MTQMDARIAELVARLTALEREPSRDVVALLLALPTAQHD
jgi:hypothetical protein